MIDKRLTPFAVAWASLYVLVSTGYAEKPYAPPICPHILGWPEDVKEWADGAPWIKALDITSVGIAKERGARVFYRVFDHDSGPDGDTSLGGEKFGQEILDRLKHLPKDKWPEAIGFQNEFNNVDEKTAQCFIDMYDKLREGGYEGMIVYGSYGPGGPTDHTEWARPHVKAACIKADAIETHEYWDLTVKHLNLYLAHRHVRALRDYPWLRSKPFFIGEFGSDGVTPSEDPHRRSGWRQKAFDGKADTGPPKLTADEYIKQIEIYRYGDPEDGVAAPAPNVMAVFLFQQGAPPHMWQGWETRGTKVMDYMKSTWKPTHGFLTGKVTGRNGKPVEDAEVRLEPSGEKTKTDQKGVFWFFAIKPGNYTVTAGKGAAAPSVAKIKLKAGDIQTKDFKLKAGDEQAAPGSSESKGVQETVLFRSGTQGNKGFRIPAAIVTKKGTLLAFAEARKNGLGDSGDIDLVMRRSTDGGATWSPMQTIWDDGPHTCGNPCPVVDRETGVIWLLLTHNHGEDTERGIKARTGKSTRTCWVSSSRDDGVTWSEPENITATTKKADWTWYATGPGCGIQLRDGRLVIPCDHATFEDNMFRSHVIVSDDHGKTWKLGGEIHPDVNECQVVELADGRLMLNLRNYAKAPNDKCRAVSISSDRGETWSTPEYDKSLPEPVCQAALLRYSTGREGDRQPLLFSNPADRDERIRMTVRLSDDEGKTWPVGRVLFEGKTAYSALAMLPDGSVACFYERGEKHPYEEIVWATFPLDWLTERAP